MMIWGLINYLLVFNYNRLTRWLLNNNYFYTFTFDSMGKVPIPLILVKFGRQCVIIINKYIFMIPWKSQIKEKISCLKSTGKFSKIISTEIKINFMMVDKVMRIETSNRRFFYNAKKNNNTPSFRKLKHGGIQYFVNFALVFFLCITNIGVYLHLKKCDPRIFKIFLGALIYFHIN